MPRRKTVSPLATTIMEEYEKLNDNDCEEIQDFGLTTSSKKRRYSLIPKTALDALAGRFELGEEKHKAKTWNALTNQEGLDNPDWVIARAEHAIDHVFLFILKYKGLIPDDGDDDAAAIMWAGACLYEAKRRKDNKPKTTVGRVRQARTIIR